MRCSLVYDVIHMEQTSLPSQPGSSSLPHSKEDKQIVLGKIVVFALVAVILLLVIVIFLLLSQRSQQVTPTISPTPTSVATLTPTPSRSVSVAPELKTYSDPTVGFSFSYPASFMLNAESQNSDEISIIVNADKLADIPEDLPMWMGRIDALKEKERLSRGEGDEIVKIGSLNGQIDTKFGQFEVCSVMFVRSVTFYPGEYRVKLSLVAPKEQISAEMPEYFKTDQANCDAKQIWEHDKLQEFEAKLASKQGMGIAQKWYDAFDPIVHSISLMPPSNGVPASWTTYTNDANGFEISYPKPYRVLNDEDNLSGYPHGVAHIYAGGQAYDIQIEVWGTKAEYEKAYEGRLSDLTVKENGDKFITLFDNTKEPENQKIIATFRLLP